MRSAAVIAIVLSLAGTAAVAQSPGSGATSTSAASAQNPAVDSPTDIKATLDELQALLRKQSDELETQRHLLERQQAQIEELLRRQAAMASAADASLNQQNRAAVQTAAPLRSATEELKTSSSEAQAHSDQPATAVNRYRGSATESGDTPLAIRFGKARLTPGGWVDFTSYYRSKDVGSGLGTSFSTIPFSNTVQGGLSETRFTAQGSRISLRADETFGAMKVFGYAEADFNGYLPPNGYVSTNSDSLRLRVYFTDLKRGRWELLAGQSWSMLTPNRVGVSPFLSEIYNTLHLDTNYQVGLTYARQTQIRAVYHFTDNVALGLSAENPEQYSGGAATFPALFSTSQTDLGSAAGGSTATPTVHPDLIAKLSADTGWGGRTWHFETAGLLTGVAILTPAAITGSGSVRDVREGGGISAAANLGLAKNLHFIATGFWSDGGGRYIGGLGPAFVVAQQGSKTSPFSVQMVHSGSMIAGTEWRANHKTVIALTYSRAYFERAFSIDPSTGTQVGYGFSGSANSNNRVLQEGTLATQTTLWRQPGYGSVQVITQSSYIQRTPWYVAPGALQNAHVFAGYANLRYVLP